ncbi:MAG: hypothetical protein ACLPSW_33680 [Roseiarcus sp.]
MLRETASGAHADRAQLRRAMGQLESGELLMVIVLDKNGPVACKKMMVDIPMRVGMIIAARKPRPLPDV